MASVHVRIAGRGVRQEFSCPAEALIAAADVIARDCHAYQVDIGRAERYKLINDLESRGWYTPDSWYIDCDILVWPAINSLIVRMGSYDGSVGYKDIHNYNSAMRAWYVEKDAWLDIAYKLLRAGIACQTQVGVIL